MIPARIMRQPIMSNDSSPRLYRPCVGIALFNAQGLVFVGERIDTPGSWQMPQGGIDPEENIESAALRELKEEIGADNVKIEKVLSEKVRYDLTEKMSRRLWGGRYVGQEQTWVVAKFLGQDGDIDIRAHDPPEFQNWKWIELEKTLDLIVPFKRATYAKVISQIKKAKL